MSSLFHWPDFLASHTSAVLSYYASLFNTGSSNARSFLNRGSQVRREIFYVHHQLQDAKISLINNICGVIVRSPWLQMRRTFFQQSQSQMCPAIAGWCCCHEHNPGERWGWLGPLLWVWTALVTLVWEDLALPLTICVLGQVAETLLTCVFSSTV